MTKRNTPPTLWARPAREAHGLNVIGYGLLAIGVTLEAYILAASIPSTIMPLTTPWGQVSFLVLALCAVSVAFGFGALWSYTVIVWYIRNGLVRQSLVQIVALLCAVGYSTATLSMAFAKIQAEQSAGIWRKTAEYQAAKSQFVTLAAERAALDRPTGSKLIMEQAIAEEREAIRRDEEARKALLAQLRAKRAAAAKALAEAEPDTQTADAARGRLYSVERQIAAVQPIDISGRLKLAESGAKAVIAADGAGFDAEAARIDADLEKYAPAVARGDNVQIKPTALSTAIAAAWVLMMILFHTAFKLPARTPVEQQIADKEAANARKRAQYAARNGKGNVVPFAGGEGATA